MGKRVLKNCRRQSAIKRKKKNNCDAGRKFWKYLKDSQWVQNIISDSNTVGV